MAAGENTGDQCPVIVWRNQNNVQNEIKGVGRHKCALAETAGSTINWPSTRDVTSNKKTFSFRQ